MADREEHFRLMRDLAQSPWFSALLADLDEEIKDGWETFISLPVEKKTTKKAQEHQAAYLVLKRFKERILAESKP